jgi:hypothetical protein
VKNRYDFWGDDWDGIMPEQNVKLTDDTLNAYADTVTTGTRLRWAEAWKEKYFSPVSGPVNVGDEAAVFDFSTNDTFDVLPDRGFTGADGTNWHTKISPECLRPEVDLFRRVYTATLIGSAVHETVECTVKVVKYGPELLSKYETLYGVHRQFASRRQPAQLVVKFTDGTRTTVDYVA